MINFYNQVPSVYTSTSRDFQYLSWLINIVLNSVKHNVDGLYDLPNAKADPRLVELLAMTLGFKVKRSYNQKQLAILVSIIPSILKYKGTAKAVALAGNALITASGAPGTFSYELDENCLKILLPKDLVDITLFMDLLPYILPAGITCRVVRETVARDKLDSIDVRYQDILYASWYEDLGWDTGAQATTGLTAIFDIDNPDRKPDFANYKHPVYKDDHGQPDLKLNAGLLDNTLIPVLDTVLGDGITDMKEEET